MAHHRNLAFLLSCVAAAACAPGGSKDAGPDVAPRGLALARSVVHPLSDECPAGGVDIETGVDKNTDGDLAADEVQRVVTVCNGQDGKSAVFAVEVDESTESCPAGGLLISMGLDADGDEVLDEDEVVRTERLCHGAAGTDGLTSLVRLSEVEAGETCPAGGVSLVTGVDIDGDGTLAENEEQFSATVCHGTPGEPGPAGTSCTVTRDEDAASTTIDCEDGTTATVYDGQDGTAGPRGDAGPAGPRGPRGDAGAPGSNGFSSITVTDDQVGDACDAYENGGQRIRTGLDNGDGNGVASNDALEDGEVDSTTYVCNGADGPQGPQGPRGDAGPAGADGTSCTANRDDDAGVTTITCEDGTTATVPDGEDGADGLPGQTGPAGSRGDAGPQGEPGNDGYSSLTVVDSDVGTACDVNGNGGQRIRSGLDNGDNQGVARNGQLESGEVDSTTYVCNGADGAQGPRGDAGPQGASGADGYSTLTVVDTDVGASCDAYGNGGQRIRSGLDNGDNQGVARSGQLESGEVDSTTYVCNGADGAQGPRGDAGPQGADGLRSLIRLDDELGGPNCPYGGTKVLVGVDDNGDGQLQGDAVDDQEVDAVTILCSAEASTCDTGYHDGGDGRCVLVGCSESFHDADGSDGIRCAADSSLVYCDQDYVPTAISDATTLPTCVPRLQNSVTDEGLKASPVFKVITDIPVLYSCLGVSDNQPGVCNGVEEVGPFAIMYTEVTSDMYRGCVVAGSCADLPNYFTSSGELPKENIDWFNAQKYCAWVGGRLPVEKEWEFAAKNGDNRRYYPWGLTSVWDTIDQGSNNGQNGSTHTVGSFSPRGNVNMTSSGVFGTADGLRDMAGNVSEWTSTKFDDNKYIYKSGSWLDGPSASQISNRNEAYPSIRNERIGFRCAFEL